VLRFRHPPVSIDIGSHSVKVAQLREARGGVRSIRYAEAPLPPGFRWEIGSDRRPLVEAIRQALARAGIRSRAAILALPRRQVTARISAYPPADRTALRRVIEYDLADQIPFPVAQVVLDFQTLGPSREQPGLADVLVVAAQRDLVREYLGLARDLGMRVAALTLDALALHDLLRLLPEGPPGITLAVEIGARATTINLSEGRRLRLTRSVGLAGQQLTLAIRDDLGVSPEEAERLKQADGFALLEREPRPERVAAWLESFHGELRRSALSFGPAAISRILLLGPGSAVPGLAEAIQAEFGHTPTRLSVAQLFPQARLAGPDPAMADHCLLAVAEALRGTGQSAWTISLVPVEVARARRAQQLRRLGLAAAAVVLAALLAGYLFQARALARQRARVNALQEEARGTDKEQEQAKRVLDERDALRQQLQDLHPAQVRRYTALELLRTISENAASGVILSRFTLRPGQPLVIEGTAPSSDAVADLQEALSHSRLVTRVSLDRVDQSVVATRSSQAEAETQPRRASVRRLQRTGDRPGPVRMAPAPTEVMLVSFSLTIHLWTEGETGATPAARASLGGGP
jgi:type IV pilus assembly protein PilM